MAGEAGTYWTESLEFGDENAQTPLQVSTLGEWGKQRPGRWEMSGCVVRKC